MPLPPPSVANGASYVRFFILGTDFGSFTISSFLVVANLVVHGGFVVTSVDHRTNGKLPYGGDLRSPWTRTRMLRPAGPQIPKNQKSPDYSGFGSY